MDPLYEEYILNIHIYTDIGMTVKDIIVELAAIVRTPSLVIFIPFTDSSESVVPVIINIKRSTSWNEKFSNSSHSSMKL